MWGTSIPLKQQGALGGRTSEIIAGAAKAGFEQGIGVCPGGFRQQSQQGGATAQSPMARKFELGNDFYGPGFLQPLRLQMEDCLTYFLEGLADCIIGTCYRIPVGEAKMASEPNLPIGIPAFPFDTWAFSFCKYQGLSKSGGQCERKRTIEDEIFAADQQLAIGSKLLKDCHSERSRVKE